MALFTFGYEGLSIGDFIARLKRADVEFVSISANCRCHAKRGSQK